MDRARYRRELGVVWLVAVASGVAATLAPGAPTGITVADAIWKGLLATAIAVAASYADRWTWVVAAATAAAGAVGADAAVVAVGFASLAVALVAATRRRRSAVAGAVSVALAVQVLLRLPAFGFSGATALAAGAACAVVVVSALVRVGRPTRRRIRRFTLWAAAALVVVLVPVAVAAVVTWRHAGTAVSESDAWLEAARRGDQPAAVAHLEAAERAFDDVESATGAWWLAPARVLPVVGPQLDTVTLVAGSGRDIAAAAGAAAQVATIEELRMTEGQIDVDKVVALDEPLRATQARLDDGIRVLDGLDTTWLLPVLQTRVDDFARQVVDAAGDTDLAVDTIAVAPALLGHDGPRTYVVLFASPAGTRELGGFVGNLGVLTADDGKVTLDEVVRARELNAETATLPPDRVVELLAAGYPDRYLRYTPWVYWQNVTGTPDFPTVSEMVRDLAPDAIGRPVDGVVYVDPEGLGALLRIAGAVDLADLDEPIGADNAADFLLRDQYVRFPEVDERADFLERIARRTFERLTRVRLPGPRSIGESLGPAVEAGHFRMWTFRPEEQAFLERVGLGARLAAAPSGDDVMVTVSNANPNKIDAYLHRTIDYDVEVDPATGAVRGTISVELRNDAPTDLSDYVIGNANDDPDGSNRTFLSLYTGLGVRAASVDGQPLALEVQQEYGLRRAAAFVTVPPGGRLRVDFAVDGTVRMDGDFRVRFRRPALVHADAVRARVRFTGGAAGPPAVSGQTEGVGPAEAGAARFDLVGQADVRFPTAP